MKSFPCILQNHILPFNWDVRKVWALKADAVEVPLSDFSYLLDLPLWSSVKGQMLFNLSPISVIENPHVSAYQTERLASTDMQYPLDFLMFDGRPWILDGVHRLARLYQDKKDVFKARFHDSDVLPLILKR